jgi:hypothetical protein
MYYIVLYRVYLNISYSIIQSVCKSLGQTSRMSSHQNKEKVSYKRKSGNECLFSFIERLRSTVSTLTVWYFTYSWYETFRVHVSNLITAELWLSNHYLYNICSKFAPLESVRAWVCLIIDCRTLSKVPGRLKKRIDRQQMRWWSVCSF